MGPAEVRRFCTVDATGKALLRTAMQQLHERALTTGSSSWRAP